MNGEVRAVDCLEGMATLDAESVDAVVTDPPYGYGIGGHKWDTFATPDEFQERTRLWATHAARLLRPDGWMAVFAAPRLAHRAAVALELAGCEIVDQIIWLFGNGAGINVKHGLLRPGHEPIILARKTPTARLRVEDRMVVAEGQPDRTPVDVVLGEVVAEELDKVVGPLTSGSRKAGVRTSIGYMGGAHGDDSPPIIGSKGSASRYFYVARDRGRKDRPEHHTVKPLSLMEWVVGLVAGPGEFVLDPFLGSGRTAMAAERCGCRWLGFEEDAAVAAEARSRISAFTAQHGADLERCEPGGGAP